MSEQPDRLVVLHGANLEGANLSGATLRQTNLEGVVGKPALDN